MFNFDFFILGKGGIVIIVGVCITHYLWSLPKGIKPSQEAKSGSSNASGSSGEGEKPKDPKGFRNFWLKVLYAILIGVGITLLIFLLVQLIKGQSQDWNGLLQQIIQSLHDLQLQKTQNMQDIAECQEVMQSQTEIVANEHTNITALVKFGQTHLKLDTFLRSGATLDRQIASLKVAIFLLKRLIGK